MPRSVAKPMPSRAIPILAPRSAWWRCGAGMSKAATRVEGLCRHGVLPPPFCGWSMPKLATGSTGSAIIGGSTHSRPSAVMRAENTESQAVRPVPSMAKFSPVRSRRRSIIRSGRSLGFEGGGGTIRISRSRARVRATYIRRAADASSAACRAS